MSTPFPVRDGYAAAWRRAPGQTAYLLVDFVLAMVALSVLSAVFFSGVGMIVLLVGLPLMAGALMIARGFGTLERTIARWTGREPIAEPEWPAPQPTAHPLTRLLQPLRSGHYWSYLAHQMLVGPIVATVTFSLAVTWWATALGGLSYGLWQGFLPDPEPQADWPGWLISHLPPLTGWSGRVLQVAIFSVTGVLFAVTLPWVISGLTAVQHGLARLMLGRWPSDELSAVARQEAAGRQSAVQAEDTAMRKLERDLHDGPQQRLIRLQLDLAAAERRAASGETEEAAEYARQARAHAQAALEELRALSRGVAPPLLADRGLRLALEAVAEQSSVPVSVTVDPDLDDAVPSEVARALYFVVAELLTNVVKHSGATQAELVAQVHRDEPARVRLSVVDNGHGGASFAAGHGLSGLRERVSGLLGTLTIESPDGGPTRVDVTVPVSADGVIG
jgi:signal transduction histidine kinase